MVEIQLPRIKFNIFSPNVFPFVMMLSLFGVIFATPYMPEVVRPYVIFVVLFAMMGGMAITQVTVKLKIATFAHIKGIVRVQNGAPEEVHFFLPPNEEGVLSIAHVNINGGKLTVHKEDEKGSRKDEKIDLRNSHMNFMRVHLAAPVSFAGFKNVLDLLFASKKNFDGTFDFRRRKKCAEWMDNEMLMDHAHSDVATCYLADLAHSDFGKDVPILYVKEAGGFYAEMEGPDSKAGEKTGNPETGTGVNIDGDKIKTKDDLHVLALEGAVSALQFDNIRLSLQNDVAASQMRGIKKIPTDAERGAYEIVEGLAQAEDTFNKAAKVLRGKRSSWLGIAFLLGVVAVAAIAYIGTSSPTLLAMLTAYWNAYWWLFLLVAAGAVYLVWRIARRGKR